MEVEFNAFLIFPLFLYLAVTSTRCIATGHLDIGLTFTQNDAKFSLIEALIFWTVFL